MTEPFDHHGGLAALNHGGPLVMGILNTTPDSFSDGGRFASTERAIAQAEQMLFEGAHIIDIGGESSRPGAEPVEQSEELRRVLPVIEGLAGRCVISIDTAKAEVAEAAVARGAHVINDITASLEEVAGALGVGWMAMHMQGEPRTMQSKPTYVDVVDEVKSFLQDAALRGEAAEVPKIWLDPGIGFGKTTEHNLSLLREVESLTSVGHNVMIGVSRKRFISEIHAESDGVSEIAANDRVEGSVVAAVRSWLAGAQIARVHDVQPHAHAAALLSNWQHARSVPPQTRH